MLLSVILIIVALALLMVMCFKGVPILLASLVAALIFAVIASAAGLGFTLADGTAGSAYTAMTTTFMGGAASFVQSYFLLFLLGALFGTMVELSGAAESLARLIVGKLGSDFVLIGVALVSAILTFGGVSVYVAFFAVYPFAVSLFKEADVPRRMFAATYMLGAGTFTMTGPFSPAVQNIIPTTYLGTTASAGATVGVIGMIFQLVVGCIYIFWRQKQCKKNGEHFVELDSDVKIDPEKKLMSPIIAILPMIILLVVLNVIGQSIEVSLFVTLIAAFILYFPYYPHDMKVLLPKLGTAGEGAVKSIMNTGATVGFGKVIAGSAAFSTVIPYVTGLGGNPLIGAAVATTVLAGLSGSASGGLGIAVPIAAEVYIPMGVNPEALHRIASVASSGLDSMPHNGAVVTFLNYSHTTHAEGYKDIFMISVVLTLIQLVLEIALFIILGQAMV